MRQALARVGAALAAPGTLGAAVALAVPPAATVALAWVGVLPRREVALALSVRIWAVAAALALVAWTLEALRERRRARALLGGAAMLLAGQAAAWLLLSGEGTIDLGAGEEGVPWRLEEGLSARGWPEARVLSIPEDASAPVRVRLDGRDVEIARGRPATSRALELDLVGRYFAPAFMLRRKGGAIEGYGYLKAVPGGTEYFQVALLPHRFYASPVPDAAAAEGSPPRAVKLRIQRGKLKVLEREVALGETVEFEGLSMRFTEGAPWVRLRARTRPPPWLLLAGCLFGGLAIAAAWRERRAAR